VNKRLVVTFLLAVLILNLMENEVEVYKAGCRITCGENLAAVEDALYVISEVETENHYRSAGNGKYPFQRIAKIDSGISARVLSNELKDLELNGFCEKSSARRNDAGCGRIYFHRLQQNAEKCDYVTFRLG
jgi:hypothetical protein